MPGRITPLVTDQIYHVLNRGISFQPTFNSKRDFDRAIEVMKYYQNRETPIRYSKFMLLSSEVRQRILADLSKRKDFLVEVIAYCLMPNHFHFILKQLVENGISNFMAHFADSYTRYFNVKSERNGPLFQGRFKAVLVNEEKYFDYLPYYIHFNPLDLIEPSWREGKIKNYQKAINFLNSYRWSSYLDYIGKKNFPSVTQREFLLDIFGGEENYRSSIKKWLKEMSKVRKSDIDEFKLITLE